MPPARFTSFLVKIASRCNLDCDYCYMYHHADQSWRSMPQVLSPSNRSAFAERLAEYARDAGLERCVVILHGGEPLLAGADVIGAFADELREKAGPTVRVDIGMQTNGLLITSEVLDVLEAKQISVSLSLDGPRSANDLHRNSRKGRSSFDDVMRAFEQLKSRPSIFAGVISVIDPKVPPGELFEFFDALGPPKLDFLLPDAHHLRPPPGREGNPSLYRDWLIGAFDLWIERYSHLPVRTFEALLDALAGLPTGTDAFGLGDVSLLSIETDGTYHDLDVLKIVGDGATRLAGSVTDTSIATIAESSAIAAHRSRLRMEGLSPTCQACPVVNECGGGSLPHRFGTNGFDNPSVYCAELLALISHAKEQLSEDLAAATPTIKSRLPDSFDLAGFELAETSGPSMALLCEDAGNEHAASLRSAVELLIAEGGAAAEIGQRIRSLPPGRFREIATEPGVVAWSHAYNAKASGRSVHDVDGRPIDVVASYLDTAMESLEFGLRDQDTWLQAPFGTSIIFEPPSVAASASSLVAEALAIVRAWRPALADEMARACRAIQLVRDPSADPAKIVSFSDNSVPGALFVSVVQDGRFIDPYDLADSLIHEHRHQKLYLLERFAPMVQLTSDLVVSPWRQDLRPPSGLMHAIFVFVELRRFWLHVGEHGHVRLRDRAHIQLQATDRNLEEGLVTLRGCQLTDQGRDLADILDAARQINLLAADA